MNLDTLLLYCLVSFFYIISPGPAIFLAIYNGAANGIKSVIAAALGNIIGLMFLSILSISGLSTILLASSTLFLLVKVVGAGYLLYLGIRQISYSKKVHTHTNYQQPKEKLSLAAHFREGLIIAITNPKPIIFFAALFPQFLDEKQALLWQFLPMTLIFMVFSFSSLFTYGYLAKKAKGFLSTTNNAKWFHRISGGLFVGMGISLFHVKSVN